MIELIKEINKILEMLDETFDFMKDFELWDNGGGLLPPLFKKDFMPLAFKKSFMNFKGIKDKEKINSVFENLFFPKSNQNILSEFFAVSEMAINKEPDSPSLTNDIKQMQETNPLIIHDSIPFVHLILNYPKMFPAFDFIGNFVEEKFNLDELLGDFDKNTYHQNPAFPNASQIKNKTSYINQQEEIAFKDFDIDLVGEELAKYIEQASINRTIADAY